MLLLSRTPGKRVIIGPVDRPTISVKLLEVHACRARVQVTQQLGSPTETSFETTIKVGYRVPLGEDIELQIHGIKGQQVSFAFRAPREVPVHREEIQQRVLIEERAASVANQTRLVDRLFGARTVRS